MHRAIVILAAAIAAVPALAQDNVTSPGSTVGPPQLRDFDLAPERERPRPQPQTQQPAPEVPAEPAPAPQAAPGTATEVEPSGAENPPPPSIPTRERPQAAPEITPEALTPQLSPAAPEAGSPAITPDTLTPPIIAPAPAPAREPAAPTEVPAGGISPAWIFAAIGIALLAGWLLLARRRRRSEADTQDSWQVEPESAPEPQPGRGVPVPPPASRAATPPVPARPAPAPQATQRPWLEVEFRPQRASAATEGASVQFELVVRNRGAAAARNVRIEGRMFNAGADHDQAIRRFYAAPPPGPDVPSGPALAPGETTTLRGSVSMARDKLREVEFRGRRLFIPMVGFNVHYEWGAGELGRTSVSYLVGREAETPSQKMGAFRLDLGPRIYRSLGQRPTQLASMT